MEREGSGKRMAIPTMVTIKEAAEKTGLSYYYIRKLCLEKKVVHIMAGRKVLINEEKLINFLNGEMES